MQFKLQKWQYEFLKLKMEETNFYQKMKLIIFEQLKFL